MNLAGEIKGKRSDCGWGIGSGERKIMMCIQQYAQLSSFSQYFGSTGCDSIITAEFPFALKAGIQSLHLSNSFLS